MDDWTSSDEDGAPRKGKRGKGKKGKRGKAGRSLTPRLGDDDEATTSPSRGKKKGNRRGGTPADGELTFKEKRQAEVEARKAKRDSKQVCRVCGGPHPRRLCPGVSDGGRGQSRWHDQAARKKEGKERHKRKAEEQSAEARHSHPQHCSDPNSSTAAGE